MGLTIDEIIQGLKETIIVCNSVFAYDRKKYIDGAIDTMRKYQKIEQILKDIPYGGEATVRRIQEVVEDGID